MNPSVTASEKGRAQREGYLVVNLVAVPRLFARKSVSVCSNSVTSLREEAIEGYSPVTLAVHLARNS